MSGRNPFNTHFQQIDGNSSTGGDAYAARSQQWLTPVYGCGENASRRISLDLTWIGIVHWRSLWEKYKTHDDGPLCAALYASKNKNCKSTMSRLT